MFKKILIYSILSILLITGLNAKDIDERFAIGSGAFQINLVDGDIPVLPGVDFRYWMKKGIGIQTTIAYTSRTPNKDADREYNDTETRIMFDFNLLYQVSKGEHVNLNLIFGTGLTRINNLSKDKDVNRTDFRVIIGFAPEIFIYDNFSLEVSGGLSMNFYGDTDYPDSYYEYDDSHTTVTLAGNPAFGIFGLGFHYYFN